MKNCADELRRRRRRRRRLKSSRSLAGATTSFICLDRPKRESSACGKTSALIVPLQFVQFVCSSWPCRQPAVGEPAPEDATTSPIINSQFCPLTWDEPTSRVGRADDAGRAPNASDPIVFLFGQLFHSSSTTSGSARVACPPLPFHLDPQREHFVLGKLLPRLSAARPAS